MLDILLVKTLNSLPQSMFDCRWAKSQGRFSSGGNVNDTHRSSGHFPEQIDDLWRYSSFLFKPVRAEIFVVFSVALSLCLVVFFFFFFYQPMRLEVCDDEFGKSFPFDT